MEAVGGLKIGCWLSRVRRISLSINKVIESDIEK